MDIFESLENLNVSEECFDEIMGLVEDTLSNLEKQKEPIYKRAHRNALRNLKGKPELETYKRLRNSKNSEDRELMKGVGASKRDFENLMKIKDLQKKVQDAQAKDQAQMGYPNRKTKSEIGVKKTEKRRYEQVPGGDGDREYYLQNVEYPHYEEPKPDKQRVKDSIARHEKKNK